MKKNDKDGVLNSLINLITSFVYRCFAYLCCWCLPKRDDDGTHHSNDDDVDYSSEKKQNKANNNNNNNHNLNNGNDKENEWKEKKSSNKMFGMLMYDDELARSNNQDGDIFAFDSFDYDLSKNKQANERNYDLDNLEKNVNLEETLSNINNDSNDEELVTSNKRITYKLSFENEQLTNINNNNNNSNNNKFNRKKKVKSSLIEEIEEYDEVNINSTASSKLEIIEEERKMDQLKQKTADLKAKLQSMKKPKEHHEGGGGNNALKKLTDKLHIKKKKTGDRSAMMDIKLKEMVSSLAEKSRLKPNKNKCHIGGGPSFGRRPSTRISKFGDSCNNSGVNSNKNVGGGCQSKSASNFGMRSDRNESYIDEIESEYRDISLVENI